MSARLAGWTPRGLAVACACCAVTGLAQAEPSFDLPVRQDMDEARWFQPQPLTLGVEPRLVSTEGPTPAADPDSEDEEYDPWEPFNELMFRFNRELDRYVLKPVATGWSRVVPTEIRVGLRNAMVNLGMPRRFVSNLLQLKIEGALRELARFVLNSTIGVAGLFDVARAEGVPTSDEDLGQTFGVYGVAPGPYLVLPFLPPSTVRDSLGFLIESLLDPLSFGLTSPEGIARRVGTIINDRSLNLELFEQVEEGVLDLYGAVRNGYL
jgi:phospholipid-binding lipoprotein MlaA